MDRESRPRASVLLYCHNLGPALGHCVSTILAQTARGIEVIIIDDGSSDEGTLATLHQYRGPLLRVIHKDHGGEPAALNLGLAHALGGYVCAPAAGVRLTPTFVERILDLFDGEPSLTFATSWLDVDNGTATRVEKPATGFPELLGRSPGPAPVMMRAGAVREAGGFDEQIRDPAHAQWDLMITLATRGGLGTTIPEVLAHAKTVAPQV